jgi:hypothetical protein
MGSKASGIVIAPQIDHAHRDEDLGVDHALLGQMLDHAPGGQFVVLGTDQQPGDGLEGFQKPVKLSKR